jgi:hypothetical protein
MVKEYLEDIHQQVFQIKPFHVQLGKGLIEIATTLQTNN